MEAKQGRARKEILKKEKNTEKLLTRSVVEIITASKSSK